MKAFIAFKSSEWNGFLRSNTCCDMEPPSCEIEALRENFVDRSESYDSFSAKSCVFLAHGLGYISLFPYIIWPKARYKKIPKTFTYYFRTITNLTKFDLPLPRDQTSRSRIWQIISENSSVGLSRLLWMMPDICKVSDGKRVVGKCLTNFLIPCFGSNCVWEWRNIPHSVHGFSCARNIQLLALNES
jgi:hypothetical protein